VPRSSGAIIVALLDDGAMSLRRILARRLY